MVTIEPIALRHAPAVQALAPHPEVTAMTLMPDPYPAGGAVEWIRHVLLQSEPAQERPFAILHDATLVGVCGFKDVSDGTAEFGYWIGRPFWGNGYATAAGRKALTIAFEAWGLNNVYAVPLIRNRASCRVLEKLGFQLVGERDNPFLKWAPEDRIAYYELERDTWGLGRVKK